MLNMVYKYFYVVRCIINFFYAFNFTLRFLCYKAIVFFMFQVINQFSFFERVFYLGKCRSSVEQLVFGIEVLCLSLVFYIFSIKFFGFLIQFGFMFYFFKVIFCVICLISYFGLVLFYFSICFLVSLIIFVVEEYLFFCQLSLISFVIWG